jgi:hypothetical protein
MAHQMDMGLADGGMGYVLGVLGVDLHKHWQHVVCAGEQAAH